MRSLLARLAVLGAFAVSMSACSNGPGGTSLPFSGSPNSAGGNTGLLQSGANGSSLLRFVHGAPDIGTVDVCVDQASVTGTNSTRIAYKGSTPNPLVIPSGIAHTITIYTVPTTGAGTECATAPGPYFGSAPVASTTLTPAANSRNYLVLGGRSGSTLGLYYYAAATFPNPPGAPEAQGFDASPTFGKVAIGAITGATNTTLFPSLNAPVASKPSGTVTTAGSFGIAALPGQPTSFHVGKPVASTLVPIVPLATTSAPIPPAGSAYVADVFSIDST
ncbi:MAG: hypothetical protein QOI11_1238, partial [Candidatus Eremiobacteraeota bacterium]|nr:hypothetical protein [Candidatus Eremiobacteraeota bacterium]